MVISETQEFGFSFAESSCMERERVLKEKGEKRKEALVSIAKGRKQNNGQKGT